VLRRGGGLRVTADHLAVSAVNRCAQTADAREEPFARLLGTRASSGTVDVAAWRGMFAHPTSRGRVIQIAARASRAATIGRDTRALALGAVDVRTA
jgi:hypothetical protein